MVHEEYLTSISAALDGELSADERRALEAHLRDCPDCARLFQELSGQSAALRALDCQPPAGLHERILSQLPSQETRPVKKRRLTRFRQLGALAACMALVAVAAAGRFMPTAHPLEADASPAISQAAVPDDGARDQTDPSTGPAAFAFEPDQAKIEGRSASRQFRNEQYIPVTYGCTPSAPSALILGSTDSLNEFFAQFAKDDLSSVTTRYDEVYFQSGQLLAVVVEAASGSTRYELQPQGLSDTQVTLTEHAAEAGTCDMAAWLIIAEVDAAFDDGCRLSVAVTP